MKIKKLGLEWGAAFEDASPIRITHNEAEVIIYITESGNLCIHTVRSFATVRSHMGGSDLEMIVETH